jgi:hypothetical protein
VAKIRVNKDPFPALRQLTWSPDSALVPILRISIRVARWFVLKPKSPNLGKF